MTTSTIAVVFFTFIIMMAAVVAIMTVIYATRLPSSMTGKNPKQKSKLVATEPTQNKAVPELTDTNSMSRSDTPDNASPFAGKKSDHTRLQSSDTLLVNRENNPDRKKQRSANKKKKLNFNLHRITKHNQPQKEQVSSEVNSKVEEPAPDNVGISVVPENNEVPELQPSINETETDTQPAEQAPDTSAGEAINISVPAITNPEVSIKENENNMEAIPNKETSKTGTDSSATNRETVASKIEQTGNTSGGESKTQQSGMGDLSDLFAKSSSEDKKANKLAEGMSDIDANELLRDSLGLINRMKKK